MKFADRRIRVGIADDHAITRQSLGALLEAQVCFEVVGEAASGGEAMELARKVSMDVLLLDIDMPGQTGVDAITYIRARDNPPAILVLSGHPAATYGPPMIAKGASGYLNKACDPGEIVKAITVLAEGREYFDNEVSALIAIERATLDAQPHHQLTHREFQVFLRLAKGQSSRQAAKDLFLSHQTVLGYRVKIMDKMQARTNSELTYYAVKHRLID